MLLRWFGAALLGAGLRLRLVLLLVRRRRKSWSLPLAFSALMFALAGLGGLALSAEIGGWIAALALAVFFFMLLWLVTSNHWSSYLATVVVAFLVVGIGRLEHADGQRPAG